jgi:hypothetical protein
MENTCPSHAPSHVRILRFAYVHSDGLSVTSKEDET